MLSTRDQYQLAYRLLRLRLASEMNSWAQEAVYRSFGISAPVLDKAYDALITGGMAVSGWSDFNRQMDFQERRAMVCRVCA